MSILQRITKTINENNKCIIVPVVYLRDGRTTFSRLVITASWSGIRLRVRITSNARVGLAPPHYRNLHFITITVW